MSATSPVQNRQRYALVQRLLHWLIALLVLSSLAGGAMLWSYGFEGLSTSFGEGATNAIYKYHKTGGVLILGLMILRLLLRLAYGSPPTPSSLSPAVARAASATHHAFYVLLILMPIVGWAATAAGGFPIEFFDVHLPPLLGKNEALSETLYQVHGALGFIIGALAILHIAAALRHWLILRDGVMQRIGLP
jgi:cytochrome b561